MSPLIWSRADGSSQPLYSPFHSKAVAQGAEAVNRNSVAALTFLVWDILITTDDEVRYIWPRSWSYPKVVYILVRYIPVLFQIPLLLVGSELSPHFHFTPHDCFIWGVYQGVGLAIVIAVVDSVLILRVCAFYQNRATIVRFLACAYAMEITGMTVGLSLGLTGITYDNVCVVTGAPGSLFIYIAAAVVFQFLLFGLTLYKFVQALRLGWGNIPIIVLLVRDGTWAFFILFFAYITQVSLYGLHNHVFAGAAFSWLLTAFSFCGYRILINLSKFAKQDVNRTTRRSNSRRMDVLTHEDIEFARDTNCMQLSCGTGQYNSYELSLPQQSSSQDKQTLGTSPMAFLPLAD